VLVEVSNSANIWFSQLKNNGLGAILDRGLLSVGTV